MDLIIHGIHQKYGLSHSYLEPWNRTTAGACRCLDGDFETVANKMHHE
jgi:hypothetical protein